MRANNTCIDRLSKSLFLCCVGSERGKYLVLHFVFLVYGLMGNLIQ